MARLNVASEGSYGHNGDQFRLMARVARMYHEQGTRQADIADRLQISQPRVSRLLKRAADLGYVRTIVTLPTGVHPDLEEAVERRCGLRQVVVADVHDADGDVAPALGAAAAEYLSSTLTGGHVVGISSWSASLLASVEAMRPFRQPVVDTVVQLVGGLGDPGVQMRATRLIGQFASHTGAEPKMLSTPAVLDSAGARDSLMSDSTVAGVVSTWQRLTVALLGIGAVEPSELARQSGNAFPEADLRILAESGAVGDICFRFFDAHGALVHDEFSRRVIGIQPEALKAVDRRVGVAGGRGKYGAIKGAIAGGWINVLVTDVDTAASLAAGE